MITNILLAAFGFFILLMAIFSLLVAITLIKAKRQTPYIKG